MSNLEKTRRFYVNKEELNRNQRFQSNYQKTTKYSIFTFLPFSLFIQFRRTANIYFLITAVLQSIPIISPLNPFSAVAPLVFVLAVSIIREGIEEYLRYRSDKDSNSLPVKIYINSSFTKKTSKDIQVGNLVMILKDQPFPCDLLMLTNSSPANLAYIETGSIDGEKNLKVRNAVTQTHSKLKPDLLKHFYAEVNCDLPNASIYSFSGNLGLDGSVFPVSKNNILLSGAVLRNTEWVVGAAVYTGSETKLRMNMMRRKIKQSLVERKVNKYILFILLLQFLLCLVPAVLYSTSTDTSFQNEYPDLNQDSKISGLLNYFTYFLLLNTMLPISLIISLEILKLVQGYFMQLDINIYSASKDQPCKVSTFSLNEELGMIQHVFTDKTGTLTANRMVFKACAIGDKLYGEHSSNFINSTIFSVASQANPIILNSKEMTEEFWADQEYLFPYPVPFFKYQKEAIRHFLLCLVLCHECLVETQDLETRFIGSSPDEIALLEGAQRLGVRLIDKSLNRIVVEFSYGQKSQEEVFELCCMFEFDSDRKRNSVIVKHVNTEAFYIYSKGADNVMFKLISQTSFHYSNKIKNEIKIFSERGLRTLVLAYREINESQYLSIKQAYDVASGLVHGKTEALAQVSRQVEQELNLLGCTAVEDSLQADVSDTIQDILKAKIKIWMLTGDKLETAENIGRTCSMIPENYEVLKIDSLELAEIDYVLGKYLETRAEDVCLIVQGDSLALIMENESNFKMKNDVFSKFWTLCLSCKSVICCRMTPKQKRDIVEAVKKKCGSVVLSIGDGANDVPMILEGNIGVGIFGEEGMQAVQASDYAIAEFRFIWELLFVHGRFNYIRQSEMILYFIYKNLVFTFPQFLFAFYCVFSGQTVYDDWYITMYNMVLTALPLMIKGLLEKDITVPKREEVEGLNIEIGARVRFDVPKLYATGKENQIFKARVFAYWVVIGLYHACLVFFIPLFVYDFEVLNEKGKGLDYVGFSITSFSCVILLVNLKLALETRFWTICHVVGILIFSISLYIAMIFLYDLFTDNIFGNSLIEIVTCSKFYIVLLVVISVFLLTDGAVFIMRGVTVPSESIRVMKKFYQSTIYIESNYTT